MCVCEFNEKIISQSVLEPEFLLSIYNINTDQSKDDYHLETAVDYALNTLLVASLVCYSRQPRLGLATYSLFVSLVCLSVFLSVCLFVCLSSSFFGNC